MPWTRVEGFGRPIRFLSMGQNKESGPQGHSSEWRHSVIVILLISVPKVNVPNVIIPPVLNIVPFMNKAEPRYRKYFSLIVAMLETFFQTHVTLGMISFFFFSLIQNLNYFTDIVLHMFLCCLLLWNHLIYYSVLLLPRMFITGVFIFGFTKN